MGLDLGTVSPRQPCAVDLSAARLCLALLRMLAGQGVEKQTVEMWIHGESPAVQTRCATAKLDGCPVVTAPALALELGMMQGANKALEAPEKLLQRQFSSMGLDKRVA